MSPGAAGRGARPLLGLRMAAAADSARATGLAFALDSGTRKSHSVAENTAFVTGFFRGISNRDTFVKLVTSLWFVYAAMEAAFDAADDPAVKAMDYPELRRRASLEQDLTYFFGGDGWQKEVQPSPATRAYVKHIESVAKGDAQWLLVAHMYTRYLGDLFGGQMMGGMAQKSLNLEGGQGIDFYTFPQIDDNKAFIEQWYSEVNQLELTEEDKAVLVEEANVVFRYNIAIFEELEGRTLEAMFSLALASLRDRFKL